MHALLYLLPLLPIAYPKSHINPHTARHLLKSNSPREVAAAAELLSREDLQKHVRRSPSGHSERLVRRRKRSCVAKTSSVTATVSSTSAVLASTMTATSVSAEDYTSSSVAATTSTTSANTTSVSSAAASSSSASLSGLSGLLAYLLPSSTSDEWTTATDSSSALSFDAALKPLYAGKLPSTGSAPDGTTAHIADYPAGIYGLSGSGFNFYSEGIHNGVDVSSASEVMFSYSVYFESDFDFNKGGKMPGLFGGTDLASAKSCSGGRQDDRDACFSARLMFRTDGAGELYNYYPVSQYDGYCSTPPYSTCNPDYGDSIARGSFTWSTGSWTTVAQRLKLNDIGQANAEQELFVNGESVISLSGLKIVPDDSTGTHIFGIMAQTFFVCHIRSAGKMRR